MTMKSSSPLIEWRDEKLPISTQFDDPYFSLQNGLEETHYVFLEGNNIAQRFSKLEAQTTFSIAELGFGTGLNFLASWALFHKIAPPNAKLHFTSFELYPLSAQDIKRSHELWPQLEPFSQALLSQWPQNDVINQESDNIIGCHFERVTLSIYLGDARQRIKEIAADQQAWFLDGFSPDKNPELWDESLMQKIFEKSAQGATFATYTAAGWVRRRLAAAGFQVERRKGFGFKRHMSVGQKI